MFDPILYILFSFKNHRNWQSTTLLLYYNCSLVSDPYIRCHFCVPQVCHYWLILRMAINCWDKSTQPKYNGAIISVCWGNPYQNNLMKQKKGEGLLLYIIFKMHALSLKSQAVTPTESLSVSNLLFASKERNLFLCCLITFHVK